MDKFVEFNPRRELGQNQYASRYIDGRHGKPNLGIGLRFNGDPSDYHNVKIHEEDAAEFTRRVLYWKDQLINGWLDEADQWLAELTAKYEDTKQEDDRRTDSIDRRHVVNPDLVSPQPETSVEWVNKFIHADMMKPHGEKIRVIRAELEFEMQLSGHKPCEEECADYIRTNPGTVRIETLSGEVIIEAK